MECAILDMNVILENFVEEAERCRFQMIEPFDEFAAWKIFNRHYAMFLLSNRAIHEHSFVCTRILQNWRSAQDSFSAIVHIPSTIPQRSLIIRKACFYRNSIDSVLIRKLFRETHNEYETFPAVRKFITGRMNHDLKFLERIFYMRDRCFFWVAQWGTEIVGCVGLLESDMIHHSLVGYLSRLSVDKRYRRQGIASILVKALESFATAKGFQELVAETINSMAAAQNTYNALGYHVSAKVEYTDFTLIRFHKKL
jgi:GNAT superfamily N-acetyltransferase